MCGLLHFLITITPSQLHVYNYTIAITITRLKLCSLQLCYIVTWQCMSIKYILYMIDIESIATRLKVSLHDWYWKHRYAIESIATWLILKVSLRDWKQVSLRDWKQVSLRDWKQVSLRDRKHRYMIDIESIATRLKASIATRLRMNV